MDYQEVQQFIELAKAKEIVEFADFGQGVNDEWIQRAQKRLKIKFPPSYIWWLKNYGGGYIYGDEVLSVYPIDIDAIPAPGDIVYMNELERNQDFIGENQLLIMTNDQSARYYFKLDEKDARGEYPVYVNFIDIDKKYADNFLDFLVKNIQEEITGV